jgi:hypothetical protein
MPVMSLGQRVPDKICVLDSRNLVEIYTASFYVLLKSKKKQGVEALFSNFRVICNRCRGSDEARLRSDPPKTDREIGRNLFFMPVL